MKSIKLSKALKEEIVQNISDAYNKSTPPPFKSGKEIDNNFAKTIYRMFIEDYIDDISRVDSRFINTGHYFKVTIGGQYKCLYLYKDNGEADWLPLPAVSCAIMELSSDAQEVQDYEQAKDEFQEWADKKMAMIKQAEAIINQVNTTKQLVDTWAEIEPMIPEYVRNPSKGIQLPAILVDTLNDSLGLNKEDK